MNEEHGTAGSSARREYERRRAKDEQRIRQRWGRFGGIAVALSDERQSTRAWSSGAVGEERVGAALDRIASPTIRVLHDRRIPSTRANIDHLVVTPGGIWVVDSKRYKGRPELHFEGGLFRPRVEKLAVGGRDKSKLVEGVEWQVEQVRSAAGVIPVTGVLCFVEADWPLIGGSFRMRGIEVLWPKKLVAKLSASAGAIDVEATVSILAARFRSAT
ncbi:MAG TPA: nuclease-related domain-containing protein [Microbacteriaceae bacterium]|nr:nuclease-related domain-containing protein [Microbacteriaceae bacterium]